MRGLRVVRQLSNKINKVPLLLQNLDSARFTGVTKDVYNRGQRLDISLDFMSICGLNLSFSCKQKIPIFTFETVIIFKFKFIKLLFLLLNACSWKMKVHVC